MVWGLTAVFASLQRRFCAPSEARRPLWGYRCLHATKSPAKSHISPVQCVPAKLTFDKLASSLALLFPQGWR